MSLFKESPVNLHTVTCSAKAVVTIFVLLDDPVDGRLSLCRDADVDQGSAE